MNIHIATQGTSTPPIIEGLRHYSVDKLYLLHNSGSLSTAREVKEKAAVFDIDCELHEINMFSQESILTKIIEIKKKCNPEDHLFINMTGGTKLMSASATVGAYMISATAYYIIEAKSDEPLSDRIIELPLPKVSVNVVKGDKLKILALQIKGVPPRKLPPI